MRPPSLRGFLLVAACSATSRAAEAGSTPCPRGERGALAELACELGRGLGPLATPTTITVAPPKSDRPLRAGEDLATRLARMIAGAIGPSARPLTRAASLEQARSESGDAATIVLVSVELAGGEIRVVADAYPPAPGFWNRVRGRAVVPLAHAFASRRVDAEVASFLPPVPLVATRIDKVPSPTSEVVALACGDVDADGSLELVVVGRRKILLGRLRAGRFEPHAETTWASLAPVAPSPLREPIASAGIAPGRWISAGLTDRAYSFRLSTALAPIERFAGRLPWTDAVCLMRQGMALGPSACRNGEPAPALPVEAGADAVASAVVVDRAGGTSHFVAFRNARDAMTELRGADAVERLAGAGAALAVGDVDRDGRPELLTSIDTSNAADDAMVVHTWSATGGPAVERLRVPAPDGIRALAVCPPDSAAMAPIVVATSKELWVVQ